jgi:hypothetical protein
MIKETAGSRGNRPFCLTGNIPSPDPPSDKTLPTQTFQVMLA